MGGAGPLFTHINIDLKIYALSVQFHMIMGKILNINILVGTIFFI